MLVQSRNPGFLVLRFSLELLILVLFISLIDGFFFFWTGDFRGSRKVKNNVELCNDLREFLSTFELPEGHVPSIKELQDHGRFFLTLLLSLLHF